MEFERINGGRLAKTDRNAERILARAVPVEQRVDGVDRGVLAKIREKYPEIVVLWDPQLKSVEVFAHPALGGNLVHQFTSPYLEVVDDRLFLCIDDVNQRTTRWDDVWAEEDKVKATTAQRQKEASRRRRDPEMAAALALQTIAEGTGKRFNLRSSGFGKGTRTEAAQ